MRLATAPNTSYESFGFSGSSVSPGGYPMRALPRSRRRPDTPIRRTCLGNAAPLRVSRPPGSSARSAIVMFEEIVAIAVPPLEHNCARPAGLYVIDLVNRFASTLMSHDAGAARRQGAGVDGQRVVEG